MREKILIRIEELRKQYNGFPSSVERWKNFSHGIDNKNLNEIDFNSLNDTELLFLFERLIRRCNTQM